MYGRPKSIFEAVGGVTYHCDDCGVDLHLFDVEHQDEVENLAKRKIQQHLRRDNETQAA